MMHAAGKPAACFILQKEPSLWKIQASKGLNFTGKAPHKMLGSKQY